MNTTESIQLGNGITVSGTPCQVYPAATVRYDPQEGVSVSYDGGETWIAQAPPAKSPPRKPRVGKPCAKVKQRKAKAPKRYGRAK